MCKLPRPGTGEDWSEKVASELAALLELPHADYELGIYSEMKCVLSRSFLPNACSLIHGNELLGKTDALYGQINISRFHAAAYTVEAVCAALEQARCELPIGWNPLPEIRTPFDVFVGYLLLDAVIGNTDRHDENWAIIEMWGESPQDRYLAPTFDHASSLGCHLTDQNRKRRLVTNDSGFTVEAYADKARSAFFEDRFALHPMSTLDVFRKVAEKSPVAAHVWQRNLHAMEMEQLNQIFAALPPERCSSASLEFARRIVLHNKSRLAAAAENR